MPFYNISFNVTLQLTTMLNIDNNVYKLDKMSISFVNGSVIDIF